MPELFVWVSEGAHTSATCPLLYVNDGQTLFDAELVPFGVAWEIDRSASELIDAGRIPPLIIVGLGSSPQRLVDYAPEPILARLPPVVRAAIEARFGGLARGGLHTKMLMEVVVPLVENSFLRAGSRPSRFAIGASMGGVAAFETLARHPDRFEGAAALSGHFSLLPLDQDPPPERQLQDAVARGVAEFAAEDLPPAGTHRLWLDQSETGLDQHYGPAHAALTTGLMAKGYRISRDLSRSVYPGTGHDEAAWRARIGDVLAWLLAP